MIEPNIEDAVRSPPHDLEAEKCVLGCILFSSDAFYEVLAVIRADHFYSGANKQLFNAMKEMYETGVTGIDVVLLRAKLDEQKKLSFVGGAAFLVEVMESVPHTSHVMYYAGIVREKYMRRQVIEACEIGIREAYELHREASDVVASVEQNIYKIAEDGGTTDGMAVGDLLPKVWDRIYERMEKRGQPSGLTTGFSSLNETIGGFNETELIVLAARPSMGKTALLCNFALASAKASAGVLLFSLEQSNLELVERFMCINGKVSGHKLRKGELSDNEQCALFAGAEELKTMPIFIDDKPGRTMSQVAAISRRMKRSHDIKLIIVDYLQLIESDDKGMPREQQIATITRRLKFLAKDLRVPVIALAQLNRGVEAREDKRPRLSDLRESGAIEQDADIVMFLHRPEAYDPEDRPGEADLIVAKNRHGPVGVAGLTWLGQYMFFGDRSPTHF